LTGTPLFLAFDAVAIARAAFLFALLLVPLVTIHELGHFVAAKAFGIKVLEFGIGFPPRVKRAVWRRGETEYTLNWIPVGGFVRLLGEEDPGDPRSLAAAPRWQRLTVMFAGVLMNFIVAVLLFTTGFMVPRDRALTLAQVTEVAPGSPASQAVITGEMRDGSEPVQGLQPGDIIIDAEGRDIANTSELIFVNRLNLGKTQTWVINRGGSTLTAEVYARFHPPAGEGPTGIRVAAPATCSDVDEDGNPINCQLLYPFSESVWYWPWEALPKGVQALVDTVVLTKNELQARYGGGGAGASVGDEDQPVFSGPVGIASTTSDIVDQAGWRSLIELAALLSLSLGVFNVLPIPGLDGGRILFVFIELARGGRRISPEREGLVHLIGIALLMAGFLVVTYFDVARLVS
jgi:regulator of sigma E protease